MDFEYLDNESENLLLTLKACNPINESFSGATIEHLIQNGYADGIRVTDLSDKEPHYIVTRLTQKGKSYFELKGKYENDRKKLTRREWIIAIVSAIIGAVIGLIPSFINWIT